VGSPTQLERIFLIGYRGTGKTTVAPLVAARLGWKWLDADAVLEERHEKSIAQIFAEEGETSFRDKEAMLLEELCSETPAVIAAGGGVVLRAANRLRLRSAGHVVWLTADPTTIGHRLAQDPTTTLRRPMLTTGGPNEIDELLRMREPLYRDCADVTVDTVGRLPEQIAGEILGHLKKLGQKR
jgi:shikimate kinase